MYVIYVRKLHFYDFILSIKIRIDYVLLDLLAVISYNYLFFNSP